MDDLTVSNWIWTQDWKKENQQEPIIVYFRKAFAKADGIKISANCRYKLYINGAFVQEGPQKGNTETAFVDTASIKKYLHGTHNVAAIEVLYYPEDGARRNDSLYYSPFPCLYVEDLEMGGELDGKAGWKYCYAHHIALRKEPFHPAPICGSERGMGCAKLAGWKQWAYCDADWREAKPYGFFEANQPVAPFHMEARTIPLMRHEPCGFQAAESINGITIPAHTTQTIVLTAGEEMCGYPTLSVTGGQGAEIVMLYSECYGIPQPNIKTPMGERPAPPRKGDRTDSKHGVLQGPQDLYCVAGYGTAQAPETYEPYLFRTFRYVQVTITTKEQALNILRYDYLSTGYPLEIKTKLTTSDPVLNQVWDISIRTLQRCMHETYVDCPFYEQLQYTMDSRAEMLFTYCVAADDRLARACMDSFRKTQRSDGILQASAPATSVNVIPGFSIFYILMVYDHMMYFGDQALVRDHFACVDGILHFFEKHMTDKGLVGSVGGILFQHPYWSFIDWCPEWDETIGVPAAAQLGDHSITMESLLYLYGLQHAAKLADYIGRADVAREYMQRAENLSDAIRQHCMGSNGLIQDGPGVELYSTHCQVWAILCDVIAGEQAKKNLENTYDVKGIPQCSVSMSFYLLLALQKMDCLDMADQLWNPWRTMIQNHMTTCVENFTDQRSDCHAWGSIILYALPAIYLGIVPTEPGFAKYTRQPKLAHFKYIKGQVCTPKGEIIYVP